jgi:hypothetical protein
MSAKDKDRFGARRADAVFPKPMAEEHDEPTAEAAEEPVADAPFPGLRISPESEPPVAAPRPVMPVDGATGRHVEPVAAVVEAPAPSAEPVYVVAPGMSLTSLRGILDAGTCVYAKDFHGGQDTLDHLCSDRGGKGPAVLKK